MEKAPVVTLRNGLRKIKVTAVIEVRRLPKNTKNLVCDKHEWNPAEFAVRVTVPGVGVSGFETYFCGRCVEEILKRKNP